MIATPSFAERSAPSPVSRRPVAKGSSQADGTPNQRSTSFRELMQQSSVGPADAEYTSSLGSPKKEGKQKKSSSDSPAVDAQALAVRGDNPQIALSFTPSAGMEKQIRSASQPAAVLPTALPVPASATQDEFRVEWNNGRDAGSPAEIAFALRLKPLGSVAPPVPVGSVRAAGEVSPGAPGSLLTAQPGNESGTDTAGGDPDSSQDHAGTHRTAFPDQLEKAAHTDKSEAPVPVEIPTSHAQGVPSQVTPLVHAGMSPAVPEGPAAPKPAAQPPPAPISTSLDKEDGLAPTRSAQEISLQISDGGDHKVDVRLVERAGEVHVIVRTPDVALAHELRQDLGNLTGKLAQSGYGTEQFTPQSAGSSNLSDQRSTPENPDPSHGNGQGPQHGGSGQQQQPQDERGKRPAWVEEMENTLAQRQTNRSTQWLFNR